MIAPAHILMQKPKPPGTAYVKPSVFADISLPYFCTLHNKHIRAEWIAVGEEVLPACANCLVEEVKNIVPAREAASYTPERPINSSCFALGCISGTHNNICQFCGNGFCDRHMVVTGPQGLCYGCGREE